MKVTSKVTIMKSLVNHCGFFRVLVHVRWRTRRHTTGGSSSNEYPPSGSVAMGRVDDDDSNDSDDSAGECC